MVLTLGACVLGCAGSPSHAGAGPDPLPSDTSVFDACVDFASQLCADAEGCCRQAYDAFDQPGCVDDFKRQVCRPGADAVTAGRAVFDASAIEDCLRAHAEAHAVCLPSWSETLELRKRIYTACHIIDGLTQLGGGCSIAATCERPAGIATVDCVKNVCVSIAILPEAAPCPFPSGAVSVCDDGLACDAARGELGECVRAIPTGGACDGSRLESTECGLGSYCEPSSSTCLLSTNMGGRGCDQSNECVSFECDRLADECSPAPAVVSRQSCVGSDD